MSEKLSIIDIENTIECRITVQLLIISIVYVNDIYLTFITKLKLVEYFREAMSGFVCLFVCLGVYRPPR